MHRLLQAVRWPVKSVAAVTLVATSFAVQADLVEFRYTAPDGQQRTLPASASYANPKKTIDFVLSGGIDRKVRVSILNSSGSAISKKTSSLLGGDDKISAGGSQYYGAVLGLPSPGDGSYQIVTDILSSQGEVVESDTYAMRFDTTGATGLSFEPQRLTYGQYIDGSTWKLGLGGSEPGNFIFTAQASGAPVSQASIRTYRANGALYRELPLEFDTENNSASLSYETSGIFPNSNLDELFQLEFVVTDAAGNVTRTGKQKARFDNMTNAPSEPFGVYDPSSSRTLGPGLRGYEPYKAGMTVKTNPVRLAYRVPRSNWHMYAESGLKIVNTVGEASVVGTDSTYVYISLTKPYGYENGNQIRWVNFGQWGGATFSDQLVLSSSAPKTPVLKDVEYRYSDIGWSTFRRFEVFNTELPISIDRVRVRVEPRSYKQVAEHTGGSCVVNAGAGYCEYAYSRTLAKGTTGYLHDIVRVWNEARTLVSNASYAEVNWNDQHYPKLSYRYDETTKRLAVDIYQADRGAYFDRLRLDTAWLEDKTGNRLNVAGIRTVENQEYYTYEWDLTGLDQKAYDLVAVAKERHGPTTRLPLFRFQGDTTAPTLSISPASGNALSSLDQISITLSDNLDASPTISRLVLTGGPTNEAISLSSREVEKGVFKLEYPIMFPTLASGEEYTLVAVGVDGHRNEGTASTTFVYDPPQVTLQGGVDGKLMIPAVMHEFRHLDGSRIIETEPLVLADGSTVAGTYDIFAALRSDAEVPLIVNGVRLAPGDTTQIMSQHDFAASDGRISLPLMAAEPGPEGRSQLLVTTSAPNAPVLLLDVHTWMGQAQLSAEAWQVRQVIDPVRVAATPLNGAMCRFTDSESEARSADPIHDPVCYIQWEELPDETEPVATEGSVLRTPRVEGQAVALGNQPVAYSLWLFSGDGSKVRVGEGRRDIAVVSPLGGIVYAPVDDYSAVDRMLHDFKLQLKQTVGPTCRATLVAEEAIEAAAERSLDSESMTCLLDWQTIPDGLYQDGQTNLPLMRGRLATNGEHALGWRLSVYSRGGTRITVNQQETTLTVVDPEAPTLDLRSAYHFESNRYVVPVLGGAVGDVEIDALPAELDLRLERDGEVLEDATYGAGWANRNKLMRRLANPEVPLWSQTAHHIAASYHLVPDVGVSADYVAIAGPPDNIYPEIHIDATEVLDTEPLPITVSVEGYYREQRGYDAAEMGQWEVRLVNQVSLSEVLPLTEWTLAEGGAADFALDLTGYDTTGMRLRAEARLISPLEGYERLEQSLRPTFLTVLRGGAIQGEVTTRRLSGEAPFIAMFRLDFPNRLDQLAIGDVTWEVSHDDGASWEPHVPDANRKLMYTNTFAEGSYRVRAHMVNRHSGVETYTEEVEVVAYPVPEVAIDGPETLFVGDSWTYRAALSLPEDSRATLEDTVVEWSLDGGQSWSAEGPELTLHDDTLARYALRVRARAGFAPADDEDAWEQARQTVEFREIYPPRIRVRGPLRVEVDQPDDYSVRVSYPYRGMAYPIRGEFTLPDGTVIADAETVSYAPTEADLEASDYLHVAYTGWFVGFEDVTRSTDAHRATLWQYVWPEFYANTRATADVAPATVSLSIRHRLGAKRLDEPTYTWSFPEGVSDIVERRDTVREFTLAEPGTYPISVTISDVRGNTTTLTEEIVLGTPEPFDLSLRYTPSNSYERAPLDVRLRGAVRGGHPRDRVLIQRFLVDGELAGEGRQYGEAEGLAAGRHYLSYQIESEMGVRKSFSLPLDVAENQLPTCELETGESSSYWTANVRCEDVDGRVRDYRWWIDGQPDERTSYRNSVPKSDYATPPVFTVVGVDDAGGESAPVTR